MGVIRGSSSELNALATVQKVVHVNASIFVYPYMPMMYFVTKGVNPTPYPFLFPGMMTEADESAVLARLKQGSPEYVMMCLVEAEQLLRIWPSIDVNRIRMKAVEGWIEEQYVADPSSLEIDGYKLYRRRNLAQ